MTSDPLHLPDHFQSLLDRFSDACAADERIVAGFAGGSYARGAADAYSDLDLYVVTADEAFPEFTAQRFDFIRRLGEPLFLEDFDLPDHVFFILSDGAEAELVIGRESGFLHMHSGPYHVVVDKKNALTGVEFPRQETDPAEQVETLRRLVYGFWHDVSHLAAALHRGEVWWAMGQLEALRRTCLTLARLRYDFLADAGVDEPYFKLEQALPSDQISKLTETFCALEPDAIRTAAHTLLRFYRDNATLLAQQHGIPYPAELDRIISAHLSPLSHFSPSLPG
jgi:predicted nucleotidyltransferase